MTLIIIKYSEAETTFKAIRERGEKVIALKHDHPKGQYILTTTTKPAQQKQLWTN